MYLPSDHEDSVCKEPGIANSSYYSLASCTVCMTEKDKTNANYIIHNLNNICGFNGLVVPSIFVVSRAACTALQNSCAIIVISTGKISIQVSCLIV